MTVVVSNTSGFYDGFANKKDDETIDGLWTFPDIEATRPRGSSDTDTAILPAYVTFGQLGRTSFSGTVNASEVQKGIVELATNAEMGTGTSVGGTGARLVPPNDQLVQTSSGAGDANKLFTLGAAGTFASGFLPVVPITKGGTGQATQTLGFDALSPTTTKGDLMVDDGTDAIRVGVGSNNTILIADSGATPGLKWGVASLVSQITFAKSTTPVTVASTASETALITVSVPGNTLGTANGFLGRVVLTALGTGNVANTKTYRLKYGSTTLATCIASIGGSSTSAVLTFSLQANASTGAQVGDLTYNGPGTGAAIFTAVNAYSTGSSSEASTGALNLVLTVEDSGSTAGDTTTMNHYVITQF